MPLRTCAPNAVHAISYERLRAAPHESIPPLGEFIGRPFDPVLDWGNLTPAIGVVRDSIGTTATDMLLVLVVVALALLVAVGSREIVLLILLMGFQM